RLIHRSLPMRALRFAIALAAFAATLHLSRTAFADVTITGTVGELSISSPFQVIRFKLTDLNQTKTCNYNGQTGYAVITANAIFYREYYAMLLVSKKDAPITCTVQKNIPCLVT